jgi:hypothetical protein
MILVKFMRIFVLLAIFGSQILCTTIATLANVKEQPTKILGKPINKQGPETSDLPGQKSKKSAGVPQRYQYLEKTRLCPQGYHFQQSEGDRGAYDLRCEYNKIHCSNYDEKSHNCLECTNWYEQETDPYNGAKFCDMK